MISRRTRFSGGTGDIHGGLDRMYAEVLAFEAALSVRFD
jgi:hypothetical protein